MNDTIIAWTDHSWNPTHGCSKVSTGCKFCYAEALSLKYGFTKLPWTHGNVAANIKLQRHKLNEPRKLKVPSKIFVNSMSDLFHAAIPADYLREIWDVMMSCPQHTFQVLTKRPHRLAAWEGPWPAHIWMGTSLENEQALARIDDLRACPAPIKFLSCEPLLGPLPDIDLTGIAWVICGGESGPHYRPMDHAWARALRDACEEQHTAFFFKQSSARVTERGTALEEEDGTKWIYKQYPGVFTPKIRVA